MTTTPQPSDLTLQLALAKMLPEKIIVINLPNSSKLIWCTPQGKARVYGEPIVETEWQHIVWLVEQTLDKEGNKYASCLCSLNRKEASIFKAAITSSWQQRVIALCKVKGIELVNP